MVALLIALIKLTQTDLNKPTRQKVMCMITLDAHNRDIQDKMYREGVSEVDAFQWQSQLKSAWDEEIDDAKQFIADAIFVYGYEYLGNGPRLVVTPLTDRIYVTPIPATRHKILKRAQLKEMHVSEQSFRGRARQ